MDENDSYSPSAQKPAQVVESWKRLGIPLEFPSFEPCTPQQITLVHASEYADGVLNCKTYNGFGNRSAQVAEALPWVCGSMVAAALYALENKVNTFSPTSGAHHAHYDRGRGFCTFNFLSLAAVMALNAGAQNVGFVACDVSHGDGTEDILRKLQLNYVLYYSFVDETCGEQDGDVQEDAGDFVLRRADGCFTCHIAVVVDDYLQGVKRVERGADILPLTGRHLLLQQALGYPQPQYSLISLVYGPEGRKLSKSESAASLAQKPP